MQKIKQFGQHFLKNLDIAQNIADSLQLNPNNQQVVIEIGPGEGVLTQFLLKKPDINLYLVEIDNRLPPILAAKFKAIENKIINKDFLQINLQKINNQQELLIVGNFPYNISSQIVFKIIDNRQQVSQMVGMFQREVAQRIVAPHGSKTYGVLSILTQIYYTTEYLFDVDKNEFSPPPQVQSAVIRLKRTMQYEHQINNIETFIKIVKAAFNQRRKKLSNALSQFKFNIQILPNNIFDKRAEQLSIAEFINLSNAIQLN